MHVIYELVYYIRTHKRARSCLWIWHYVTYVCTHTISLKAPSTFTSANFCSSYQRPTYWKEGAESARTAWRIFHKAFWFRELFVDGNPQSFEKPKILFQREKFIHQIMAVSAALSGRLSPIDLEVSKITNISNLSSRDPTPKGNSSKDDAILQTGPENSDGKISSSRAEKKQEKEKGGGKIVGALSLYTLCSVSMVLVNKSLASRWATSSYTAIKFATYWGFFAFLTMLWAILPN